MDADRRYELHTNIGHWSRSQQEEVWQELAYHRAMNLRLECAVHRLVKELEKEGEG